MTQDRWYSYHQVWMHVFTAKVASFGSGSGRVSHIRNNRMKSWNWFLYAFFWVISRRLNFICRRFGTLYLFHLHRQVGTYLHIKMEQTVFRNVGIQNSDAGKLPRRKQTTFRTQRKFEIKNKTGLSSFQWGFNIMLWILCDGWYWHLLSRVLFVHCVQSFFKLTTSFFWTSLHKYRNFTTRTVCNSTTKTNLPVPLESLLPHLHSDGSNVWSLNRTSILASVQSIVQDITPTFSDHKNSPAITDPSLLAFLTFCVSEFQLLAISFGNGFFILKYFWRI